MIVVKETDAMTTLAEAAKAYKETKEAHKQAANVAREAVLAALKAGNSVPEVTKAGPFTYAYVRGIAEDNGIPRDERKARYGKRNIGLGSVGIGDTPEEAAANSGPIDTGADLRALVLATPRQRIVKLIERVRREDAKWYRSMQDVVNAGTGDVAVEILVYALAENRLTPADFAG
jgi:hypothetical protein